MKKILVRELMIPLDSFPSVNEDATLADAIMEMQRSQLTLPPNLHRYRAIIVKSHYGKVIGKLGHFDFLRALEPKYTHLHDIDQLRKANLSVNFINDIMEQYHFWEDEMYDLYDRIYTVNVKEYMQPIDRTININASLPQAIHQLLMQQNISLMVADGDEIIGILRISEIYNDLVSRITKESE